MKNNGKETKKGESMKVMYLTPNKCDSSCSKVFYRRTNHVFIVKIQ